MATIMDVLERDPADTGHPQEIDDFTLTDPGSAPTATSAATGLRMRVIARSGLRLRAGPGVEFDSLKLLPFGSVVMPLRTSGSWTMVDLNGDGAADGFVSGAYLTEMPQGPSAHGFLAAAPRTADAIHVAELIRQGSSAHGLRAARTTAAAALPGYPTNGCAAHLSALLQQSGIDVAMTFGAGKLAHRIADRGWSRIHVGSQAPGDVGVCFDNDPTPAGADHIYLVVATNGPDEMMIADNQRTADAPHKRFASGKGKTPTEYFLRAI